MENGIHFDGEQGRRSANEVVPSDRRNVRSGQSRDELRHCREKCSAKGYSITSLARTRRAKGTVRPSSWAVLRLTSKSCLAGACTGKSQGLLPLGTRSTYEADG